ncbi:MAG: MFS transporter [Planctomycetaceae bacterium]|nr:MFS transporter [Planctomycetaceae bacterium]|tara:strand:- start:1407 stop:3242 length:1836 start_codon:yes stop_codon:yes gene_type:complete
MSRVRYFVVFVSMLMAVLLYLDRFCVSFAADYIREDLDLSQNQVAWMFSIFFWSYALAQVPSGWLSDRYGSRIMLSIYIISWSLFTLLTGIVSGVIGLLIMRLACGLGQAGAYPTSASIVSKWIPLTGRAAASSIVALGGRCGGAIAPVLTALLMVTLVPISGDGSTEKLDKDDLLHTPQLCNLISPDDDPTVHTDPGDAAVTHTSSLILDLVSDDARREITAIAAAHRQAENERPDGQHSRTSDEVVLSESSTRSLVSALNNLLETETLFDPSIHEEVSLPREGLILRDREASADTLTPSERRRFHRLLLEVTFPQHIRKIYVDGWRPVMYIYGIAGFLVAGVYWLVVRNHPSEHPRCQPAELELIAEGRNESPSDSHVAEGGAPLMALIRSFSMWCDCFMQTGTNIAWVFLVTWLPRYLREVHDVPIEWRGLLAGLPLAAGVVGMLLGGKATDLLTARIGLKWGRRWPLFATKISGAAAYGCCLLFSTLPTTSPLNSAAAFTVCFCVVSFSVDFGNPANWAFKQDVGGRYVGSVLGWGNMWGNLGAAISPLIYNFVLGEHPALADWNNMMLVCLLAFVVAGICALGIDATQPIVAEEPRSTVEPPTESH